MESLQSICRHIFHETQNVVFTGSRRFINFVLPKWSSRSPEKALKALWNAGSNTTAAEFLLRHFDLNQDGHISTEELLNMTDILLRVSEEFSWSTWFRNEWPLMDWKVGVFLWQTFGGMLIVLTVLSIVPGRLHGISAQILRWPVLGLTYFLVAVELMVYVVIRLFIRVAEYLIARPKHRKLRRKMAGAKSYPEWYNYALQLDVSQQRDRWLRQDDDQNYRYNWIFIRELIKDMQRARTKGDTLLALAVLQQCTRKNVGGIMSEEVFSFSNRGEPKYLVKEFVEELVTTLHWVTNEAANIPVEGGFVDMLHAAQQIKDANDDNESEHKEHEEILHKKMQDEKERLWQGLIQATLNVFTEKPKLTHHRSDSPVLQPSGGLSYYHRMEILLFLKRARAAYGRTALCLSGGAMMGLMHLGHVLGLLEAGVLPHIISGTSGGSVIGALLCTRTDDEIRRDLNPQVLIQYLTCFDRPWPDRLRCLWNHGHMFEFETWMEKIQWFTSGTMTFAEAYRKTGRIFCVTLSSTTRKAPPVLLNYMTAPNVTIASAVVASAAVPGFIPPVRLQYKDGNGALKLQEGETYFDGSIRQDIPVSGLAEMLNCQFFIVCQTNPHIIPFFYNSKGGVGRPSRWSSGTQESSWRGGYLLASLERYLKSSMQAKFRFLHDMEAAVGFTSTMMVQEFVGSTTIVPQVLLRDFFKLFSDPSLDDLFRYFQAGSVAAYEHIAMIKLHYSLVDVLDECIQKLETSKKRNAFTQPRRTKILIPESRHRAKIFIADSHEFARAALTPSAEIGINDAQHLQSNPSSFTGMTFDDDDEEEDEIERNWVNQNLLY